MWVWVLVGLLGVVCGLGICVSGRVLQLFDSARPWRTGTRVFFLQFLRMYCLSKALHMYIHAHDEMEFFCI